MLIRMLTTLAGPDGIVQSGKCCNCDPKRAKELIDSFHAEEVKKEDVKDDFVQVHLKDKVEVKPVVEKKNESASKS